MDTDKNKVSNTKACFVINAENGLYVLCSLFNHEKEVTEIWFARMTEIISDLSYVVDANRLQDFITDFYIDTVRQMKKDNKRYLDVTSSSGYDYLFKLDAFMGDINAFEFRTLLTTCTLN